MVSNVSFNYPTQSCLRNNYDSKDTIPLKSENNPLSKNSIGISKKFFGKM